MGFSPWDCKELDTTEQLTHTFPLVTGSSEMGQEFQELPPPSTMQSLSPRDRVSAAAGCGAGRASATSAQMWLLPGASLLRHTQPGQPSLTAGRGAPLWLAMARKDPERQEHVL